jgi:hypothetical protein
MVHNKVDFSKNINAYYDSGENKKAEKLLMSELGQLMIYHRGHIISALNEAGIETNKDASDKEIANKLASNLAYNDGLRIAISLLLNNLNANSFYQATGCPEGYIKQYFNADDDKKGGGFGAFLSSLTGSLGGGASSGGASGVGGSGGVPTPQVTVGADPVSAIAGAIGSIFSFAGSKTAQKTEREKSKSEKDIQRLALAQQILGAKNSQQPPTGMSGGTKATLIILGLLAVGTTVYFVMKKK